ncbi:formylglycine-generating enzyme family protein [Bradyrhizobium icense]|nr:formylglycine-generating enzyme family protein [Bradyrhizobium icense]
MRPLYLLLGLILLEACGGVDGAVAETVLPISAAPTVLTIEQEKNLASAAGSEFRECAVACPLMVIIPAGKSAMGSPEGDVGRTKGEHPRHEATIAKPFAVSKYEVTFDQWDACVAAAACPHVMDAWGRGNMPVINVSWGDAKLFVAWLSRLTGKEYRLLTEAEWEYAARAGVKTPYSWGDEPGIGNANCSGCGGAWTLQTAPVGSFRPNAFGLHDMEGNVWEWVEDIWHDSHEGTPANGAAKLQGGDPTYRVIRGGSWHNETELVRTAIRFKRHSKVQFDTLGFRVGRTMGP